MFFGLIVSNVHIWIVSDQGLSKSVCVWGGGVLKGKINGLYYKEFL